MSKYKKKLSSGNIRPPTLKQIYRKPQNPYHRFQDVEKAGHVLASLSNDNQVTLHQHAIPSSTQGENTFFRTLVFSSKSEVSSSSTTPLKSQHLLQKENLDSPFRTPQGNHRVFPFEARTEKGTKMVPSVSYKFTSSEEILSSDTSPIKHTKKRGRDISVLFLFKPENAENNSNLINQPQHKTLFRKKSKKRLKKQSTELKYSDLDLPTTARLEYPHVMVQPNNKKRKTKKTQNAVAGISAREALKLYLKTNESHYDLKTFAVMQQILKGLYAVEWIHCVGRSTVLEAAFATQIMENLRVGPKWFNTYMMSLEIAAKYFAIKYPETVDISPRFQMLPESVVIAEIRDQLNIADRIQIENRVSTLDLPRDDNWPHIGVSKQLMAVTEAILNKVPPKSSQTLKMRI